MTVGDVPGRLRGLVRTQEGGMVEVFETPFLPESGTWMRVTSHEGAVAVVSIPDHVRDLLVLLLTDQVQRVMGIET
jgi:hypothetical protein